MIRKILEACPSCGGQLEIGEVHCLECETVVHAHYRPCDFCALTDEQSTFLRLFVISRGNLSEVEKRLGVSYPTVRAKLDEVIERLSATEAKSVPVVSAPSSGAKRKTTPPPSEAAAGVATPSPPPQPQAPIESTTERRAVLQAVERGDISATEALRLLNTLGGAHDEQD